MSKYYTEEEREFKEFMATLPKPTHRVGASEALT